MYAIGGSADPTIFSEANYFIAPDDAYAKEVRAKKKKILFFLLASASNGLLTIVTPVSVG